MKVLAGGAQVRAGYEIAVEQINAAGSVTVGGRKMPLELTFANDHISYYPAHPFSPHWTFDALLMTFIGGVGTLQGPGLGAVLYVVLKEDLALRWVDLHLLIFGALFIAIVLVLPGGLVQAVERARRLTRARGR